MLENVLVGFAQLDEAILRLLSGVLVRVILQRQCVKAFAHLVQRLLRRDAEQVAGLLVLRLDSPILRIVLEGTVLLPRGVERRREVEPTEEGPGRLLVLFPFLQHLMDPNRQSRVRRHGQTRLQIAHALAVFLQLHVALASQSQHVTRGAAPRNNLIQILYSITLRCLAHRTLL